MKTLKMKYVIYFFVLLVGLTFQDGIAQTQNPLSIYRAEKEAIFDLQHTKLAVSFDFQNKEMAGEAWITLQPHFYESKTLVLDAKAMLIHEVTLGNKKVPYFYDGFALKIDLPRAYKKGESLTLYIRYTARPEKVKQKGSAAITDAKGLYFINANGLDRNKPTQIWTQGETESSSCWFPTIDSPNQKTTQEISITVPKKYVTLSNGALVSSTPKGEMRTDYWKLDKKHAPYLFFMGVGEYEIVRDQYKNIPVDYYVEKEYAPYAKDIFGNTPEMMGYFSELLGVEYPWNKYSQIVGRDYVSGAMENTTAVLHGEGAYQKPGQLIDQNVWEDTIAHELFHHWFGDLVTAESWSNLTLNESFANYSEYLWRAYKYGEKDASVHRYEQIEAYKEGQNFSKDLVRFYYDSREDMFDAVSYNKGGAILHMLRKYIGDEAFFGGLKTYLERYAYQSAEVHQLRLIFEEITGKDLNWFFNQWYYNNGHPEIQVSYDYNTLEKTVTVNLYQTQDKAFQFPITIDIFEAGKKTRHTVFVEGKDSSFTFPYTTKNPSLILVNADDVLLADFKENKILSDYIFQLKNASSYRHKREALLEIVKRQEEKDAFEAITWSLQDEYDKIRILALENIDLINKFSKSAVIEQIKNIAQNDKKTLVQAAALETLGKLIDLELKPLFEKALTSKSYSVLGNALVGLYYIDKANAVERSKKLPSEVRQIIATPLTRIYIEEKDDSEMAFIAKNVLNGMFLNSDKRVQAIYKRAFDMISKSNNLEAIQNLSDDIVAKGIQYKQYDFHTVGINLLRQMVQFQRDVDHPDRERNIKVIKTAIAKLIL